MFLGAAGVEVIAGVEGTAGVEGAADIEGAAGIEQGHSCHGRKSDADTPRHLGSHLLCQLCGNGSMSQHVGCSWCCTGAASPRCPLESTRAACPFYRSPV